MNTRLIGLSLLLGASACATNRASTFETRKTLAPQDGPHAHVYAAYSGGLTWRTVRSSFRTEQDANVIVGRLGGDGRVEILYPESPKASGAVKGGKTYEARAFRAEYDGIPQLYSYASFAPRAYGAQVDSYDGRGNGFIFVIATQYPMFTEMLDDHGRWSDDLQDDDYYSSSDPRYSIRNLAEQLTRGMPYSLDYADRFTTQSFTGYADVANDCAQVAAFGYSGMGYGGFGCGGGCSMWTGYGFGLANGFGGFYASPFGYGSLFSRYSPFSGCGFAYDRGYLSSANWYRTGDWYRCGAAYFCWEGPGPRTPYPHVKSVATFNVNSPVSPTAFPSAPAAAPSGSGFTTTPRRPGTRSGTENGFTVETSHFRPRSGASTSSGSSWGPPIRPTQASGYRPERPSRPNSGGSTASSSGGSGGTRAEAARPSAPATAVAPQSAPPPKVAATADAPRKP